MVFLWCLARKQWAVMHDAWGQMPDVVCIKFRGSDTTCQIMAMMAVYLLGILLLRCGIALLLLLNYCLHLVTAMSWLSKGGTRLIGV